MPRIIGKHTLRFIIAFWNLALALSLSGCGDISDSGSNAASPGVQVSPASTTLSENGGSEAFTAALKTAPNGNVALGLSSSDTSEAIVSTSQLIFTPDNWSQPQLVLVSAVDDNVPDGNQTVEVTVQVNAEGTTDNSGYAAMTANTVGALKVTVIDDDTVGVTFTPEKVAISEGGPNQSKPFDVRLNTEPNGDVAIDVASSDSDLATANPTQLIFTAADWSSPQTVTVSGVDNSFIDGNRTAQINLSINEAGTVDSTGYPALTIDPVPVEITDDDKVGMTVSQLNFGINEKASNQTDEFSVRLNTVPSPSDSRVVLNITSTDTSEAIVNPSKLTFTPDDWLTKQIVTVTAVPDDVADGNQIIFVRVTVDTDETNDTSGYADLAGTDVRVTVFDRDVPGLDTDDPGDLAVFETGTGVGSSGTFQVWLKTRPDPGKQVTVKIESQDTGEVTVHPAVLTFTDINWSTRQTVTFTGVPDGVQDGNQTAKILITVDRDPQATTDPTYANLPPEQETDVSVTVFDNDF